MKSSSQDAAESKVKKMTGSGKEFVGKVIGDQKLERKGRTEKTAGKVQEKVGQVKKVLGK
jgi:uncharacterized protein YjbJ (UPF0337 family)